MGTYTLAELARSLNGRVHGDDSQQVDSLATLAKARPGQLSFLSNPKYASQLATTQATAVLVSADAVETCPVAAIEVENPYYAFARVGQLFDRTPRAVPGRHPSATIDDTATVPASACIGPNVVIGAEVCLGENVVVGANSVIADWCVLGDNCVLKQNVTLYHDVRLGERCMVHAGAVLGSDGFGNARDEQGNWMKVPQLGGVQCGNDVEIGANATIDRGAIDDTVLADGVKIDNLVQVAHNVEIGKNTALAAQVGVAGSSKIGENCLFGGQVGITGHVRISDNVVMGASSVTARSLSKPGVYMCHLDAMPHIEWKRILGRLMNINKMYARLTEVEKKLEN